MKKLFTETQIVSAIFTFYLTDNYEVCFLNSKHDFDEFSYGKVYGVSVKNTEFDGCKAYDINFRWFYLNSYDKDFGYAFVQLRRIYRGNGIEFVVKIISKKLDIIEFSGFSSEMRLESDDYQKKISMKLVTRHYIFYK